MRGICTVQIACIALVFSLVPPAVPAQAQVLPPEGQRTVQWYATHPRERDMVRRACQNDPGHLQHSPDCINASRGDLEAAANAPRGNTGTMPGTDRNMIEYWANHPNDRTMKLAYCGRMTPEAAAKADCGSAQQSLLLEQQRARAGR